MPRHDPYFIKRTSTIKDNLKSKGKAYVRSDNSAYIERVRDAVHSWARVNNVKITTRKTSAGLTVTVVQ